MFKKFYYHNEEVLININKINFIKETSTKNTVSIHFDHNYNTLVDGNINKIEKIINENN